MEFRRRFELSRAPGKPEEAIQPWSSIRFQLYVLQIHRYHFRSLACGVCGFWLSKYRSRWNPPGKCFFPESGPRGLRLRSYSPDESQLDCRSSDWQGPGLGPRRTRRSGRFYRRLASFWPGPLDQRISFQRRRRPALAHGLVPHCYHTNDSQAEDRRLQAERKCQRFCRSGGGPTGFYSAASGGSWLAQCPAGRWLRELGHEPGKALEIAQGKPQLAVPLGGVQCAESYALQCPERGFIIAAHFTGTVAGQLRRLHQPAVAAACDAV